MPRRSVLTEAQRLLLLALPENEADLVRYTTYLGAAMRHLEHQGRSVPPGLLQHLSPLGWQHINLTGDYLWTDADIPEGKLRPLRQAITITDNP